jgi:hypothetical protein
MARERRDAGGFRPLRWDEERGEAQVDGNEQHGIGEVRVPNIRVARGGDSPGIGRVMLAARTALS